MIKNLNYELTGNGRVAIVFLHGWGMTGDCFDGVIERLQVHCSILKLDFFSFGKSDMPESYFDTYEYAYYVYLLLKSLEIERVVLVGHSFGGRVSIILSSIFDIDIVGCVLTSSAGINRFDIVKILKIWRYKLLKFLVNKRLISNGVLNGFGSNDFRQLESNMMRNIFIRIVNQDLRVLLSKINCMVYLVWDKKDDVTPYWICNFLSKNLKYQNKIILNNGKHFVFMHNINKFANIVDNVASDRLIDTK